MGAKPSQYIKEALRECWCQVLLPTRAWCHSLGSNSRGRGCRKDAESLPAQPESISIHPTESHGLSELCMLPEWHSCPGTAPGAARWHSGVSCRACLRDQSTSKVLLYPSCCREWWEKKHKRQQINTWLSLVSLAEFMEEFWLWVSLQAGSDEVDLSQRWSKAAVQCLQAPASFHNAEVCRAGTIHSFVLAQIHGWTLGYDSGQG